MTTVSKAWLKKHAPNTRQDLSLRGAKKTPRIDHADTLAGLLKTYAPDLLAQLAREYSFALPRRYRADFAHVSAKVLIEVDGGRWSPGGGRHMSDNDLQKQNTAALLGYRVLHFSPAMLQNDPLKVVEIIRKAIEQWI